VVLGWNSAPGCVQHDVSPADGVYKAYEKCADFFTFGHGSKLGTAASGVNVSYWILVTIGFLMMIAFLVAWVVLEDRKLRRQAAQLLTTGAAGQVSLRAEVPQPGTGGPA
jgi:lipoprotein signal peptidase